MVQCPRLPEHFHRCDRGFSSGFVGLVPPVIKMAVPPRWDRSVPSRSDAKMAGGIWRSLFPRFGCGRFVNMTLVQLVTKDLMGTGFLSPDLVRFLWKGLAIEERLVCARHMAVILDLEAL